MHVGFSAVFAAPSADGERFTVEALRERAARRIPDVPWARWRLDRAPLGLTEPRWIEDPDFDVATHIVQLTERRDIVSYRRFESLRCEILSEPLDRSRPLWEISLVPLLEDGRIGMVGKIHHALADGFAALQIVSLIVDDESGPRSQEPPAWHPRGRPGKVGWALDALKYGVDDGLGVGRAGAHAVTSPGATVRGAVRGMRGLAGAIGDVLDPAPQSTLNAPTGARRTLVGYHARRAELRAARRGGGTVNDVGLAVVAGALRALSGREGALPSRPLKAMIPVSMRTLGDTAAGNQISMLNIRLPVHLASRHERLGWVRRETDSLKYTDRPSGAQTLYQAGGLLPAPLRGPVVKALSAPRVFNLTISQSPAPRGPLYVLGCELEEVYSVVPIAPDHALAIGMVRYNQELFFGCHADPDAFPAIHDLPALLGAEVRALGDPRQTMLVKAPARPGRRTQPAVNGKSRA
jgi:WS/DGAT/MGAT family acyltransferase